MIIRAFVVLAGLAGAVAASQILEPMQQYRQRLGGAVGELARWSGPRSSGGTATPRLFDGMVEEFVFVIPTTAEAVVAALMALLLGLLRGVGRLFRRPEPT